MKLEVWCTPNDGVWQVVDAETREVIHSFGPEVEDRHAAREMVRINADADA